MVYETLEELIAEARQAVAEAHQWHGDDNAQSHWAHRFEVMRQVIDELHKLVRGPNEAEAKAEMSAEVAEPSSEAVAAPAEPIAGSQAAVTPVSLVAGSHADAESVSGIQADSENSGPTENVGEPVDDTTSVEVPTKDVAEEPPSKRKAKS